MQALATVSVHLGDRSYPIVIGNGILETLGDQCKDPGAACLIITDSNVGPIYAAHCSEILSVAGIQNKIVTIPAGESSKSHEVLMKLYRAAINAGLDRTSFVIALGGGVVGDLAGYAAATFLRGIKLVQVPSSLLAMVDSAVGGKTGINLPEGKNLIGAFHQPNLVLVDLQLLKTLPEREFRSGMAEVVKYGMIRDASFFSFLEKRFEDILALKPEPLAAVVQRCCEIKADVVGQDEREGGLRAILNYGHTLGHALERVAGYGHYLHGEAISIGMHYAALLSKLTLEERTRQEQLLTKLDLPVHQGSLSWEDTRPAMNLDKKTQDSRPRFVLVDQIGKAHFGNQISEEKMLEAWYGCCK